MPASITLSVNLGPLVSLKVSGQSCQELAQALEGYSALNVIIDSMCGDLAERIYPEGTEPGDWSNPPTHDSQIHLSKDEPE